MPVVVVLGLILIAWWLIKSAVSAVLAGLSAADAAITAALTAAVPWVAGAAGVAIVVAVATKVVGVREGRRHRVAVGEPAVQRLQSRRALVGAGQGLGDHAARPGSGRSEHARVDVSPATKHDSGRGSSASPPVSTVLGAVPPEPRVARPGGPVGLPRRASSRTPTTRPARAVPPVRRGSSAVAVPPPCRRRSTPVTLHLVVAAHQSLPPVKGRPACSVRISGAELVVIGERNSVRVESTYRISRVEVDATGLVDRMSRRAQKALETLVRKPEDTQANRQFRTTLQDEHRRDGGSAGDTQAHPIATHDYNLDVVDCALVIDGDSGCADTELRHDIGTVSVDMAALLSRDAKTVEALAQHLAHPDDPHYRSELSNRLTSAVTDHDVLAAVPAGPGSAPSVRSHGGDVSVEAVPVAAIGDDVKIASRVEISRHRPIAADLNPWASFAVPEEETEPDDQSWRTARAPVAPAKVPTAPARVRETPAVVPTSLGSIRAF